MKLTLFGKIIVFGFFIVFVAVLYLLFLKPEETGPDYSMPAPLSFSTKNLPLTGASRKAFNVSTSKVTNYCSFFQNYGVNRGTPISFNAFIPPDYRQSLYYYQDPKTGEQYIPSYYIPPGGNGLALASAFADEDYERLPACVSEPPEGSGGLMLLGFPKGRIPSGNYTKVYGSIWWDSISLNPGQVASEAGAETAKAPIIKVADYDNLTDSQAKDPANKTFLVNSVVQVGRGVIRVKQVEFGDKQTRVLVEIFNVSSKNIENWLGATASCIRPAGEVCSTVGSDQTNSDEEDTSSSDEETNSDILQETDSIPPASTGASLTGYLTFERFDPDQQLQLEMPDFVERDTAQETAPIIVNLPNEKTSRAVDEDSKGNKVK